MKPKTTIAIVSVLLLISTLAAWYFTRLVVKRETKRVFAGDVNILESWTSNRFENYVTIVYGIRGFIEGSDNVTRQDWNDYVGQLDISERYNGIASIAYVKRVSAASLDSFIQEVRAEGGNLANFDLRPKETKDEYYIVTYVYPEIRSDALGFDITSEGMRLEALEKARDLNATSLTGGISLAADQGKGFFLLTPLYTKGLPLDTDEQLREAIGGAVIVAFLSDTALSEILGKENPFPHMDFEIYKGRETTPENKLYDHDPAFAIFLKNKDLEDTRTIIINGEVLTLLVAAKPSYGLRTLEMQLPNTVLGIGLLFDVLITAYALRALKKAGPETA